MGLFRPYERQTDNTADEAGRTRDTSRMVLKDTPQAGASTTPVYDEAPAELASPDRRKSEPTRTRREAEEAKRASMRPKTKKEMRKAERDARYQRREAELAAIDKRPEQQLMRDYVDSKRHLLEFMLPVLLLAIVGTFVATQWPAVYVGIMAICYALIIGVIVELWLRWRGLKRLLMERYPRANRRGLFAAMMGRMSQFRRFRLPPPRVEVGDEI